MKEGELLKKLSLLLTERQTGETAWLRAWVCAGVPPLSFHLHLYDIQCGRLWAPLQTGADWSYNKHLFTFAGWGGETPLSSETDQGWPRQGGIIIHNCRPDLRLQSQSSRITGTRKHQFWLLYLYSISSPVPAATVYIFFSCDWTESQYERYNNQR